MAASADSNSSRTAGDDRNLVTIDENYLAPSFEDRVVMFWEKHGRTVTILVVAVALGLVGRWAFGQYAEARERAIAAEFAAARDAAGLRKFIESNPSVPLTGAAHLKLADEAYVAGDFAAAQTAYDAASKALAGLPLGDRARLGLAIAKLQAGDSAGAKTALETLANDVALARTLRGEAGFHLAVLARDAGQVSDAHKWAELVLAADPAGLWAQRVMQLRAALPPVETPVVSSVPSAGSAAAAPGAPATVSFPGTK